ncbi:MAG: heme-binding domain-containing protein [Lutibacter sp.]|nr:heme-binding domain-containing protein [Lutibacter sp.]MDT8416697.1 heme-binding domain-containing protein [Lutibacter sp.]
MKLFKKLFLFLLIVFVGIQFMPTTRNQSNEVLETDFTKTFTVPNNIQSLLKNSCYDCHSNNTNYPWYNKIQPVSWFLEYHIKEGKKELNFSEFGGYSKRRQKSKLKSIKSQIEKNEMPLSTYTIFHRDVKLSENDKKLITNYLNEFK